MDAAPHKANLHRLPLWTAIFVALVCAAFLVSAGWGEWSSREVELANSEVELGNLARSLNQHADDTLELAQSTIAGIVARLETDGAGHGEIEGLQAVLNIRKAALGRIRGLFIFDENGRWLATTENVHLADFNNSDREYFLHHRQSADRDMFIGQPIRSKSGGQWVVTLSRRWNHPDGAFAGVVLATVDAQYFSGFFRQFDIGAEGTITLLRSDGIILARRPDEGVIGRDVSTGPVLRLIRSGTGAGPFSFRSTLDGLQRLAYYQRSDRYPVIVMVTKTESELLGRWRHDAMVRMTLGLGLVTLIAIIGAFLVRQLDRGRHMAAALASKEANFRVLAEGSSDMVTRIDMDGRVQYASPSSVRVLGWPPEQLVGTKATDGIHPEDLPRVEEAVDELKRGDTEDARVSYRARHRGKVEVWIEAALRITRGEEGELDGIVAVLRDVTQQKKLEGRLETLATEDGLTGLSNRRHFDERLLQEFGRAYREHTCLGILMIDLDHFKQYNDEYGHLAGDECLRAVAKILAEEAQRTTDLAARFGGEEFVMLLPNTDAVGCARIGERIRRALREAMIPHALNKPAMIVTASIGGAVCRPGIERTAGPASVIEAADRALYGAKDGGRDRLVMASEVVTALPAASALRRGIRELQDAR